MIRQQIIRDKDYNIIETIDGDIHIKYNTNDNIIYYKSDNFIFPSQLLNCESPQEQEFIDFVKDSTIEINETIYPNTIFLFKGNKSIFEFDLKNEFIFFNISSIWRILETKYSMSYQEVQKFMKYVLEKYFNCKDVTPRLDILEYTSILEKASLVKRIVDQF